MAKSIQFAPVVATVLCFSSLLSSTVARTQKTLFVEGKVYCDTCRVEFETKLSEPIDGATVALECRTRDGGDVVYSHEVLTHKNGGYRIPAQSGHAELICEVRLVKSPNPECNQIDEKLSRARILLSTNVGMVETVRHANSLGFIRKEAVAGCPKVQEEMGFDVAV